ncbi:MAG TPA: response regulator [Burkholderiales bacterium]|nr:response regulator [Burkholderiales bacterium]
MAADRMVTDEDVYALTRQGEEELRGAKTRLPSSALDLLVRIDGRSSVAAIRSAMAGVPPQDVAGTFEWLRQTGLIERAKAGADGALDFFAGAAAPLVPTASAVSSATNEAGAGVTSLQQQGYYVRIARRPAAMPQLPTDRRPLVVVVEDEPHLAKFLKHFLALEGFDARIAGNRAEIVEAVRLPPRPDLVLLDVMLPDADGFDVLTKMRGHPALADVPIIMLTAKTTREAVIKGLAHGADGYITKPFQTDVLIKAMKTVFGMPHA